MVSTRSRSGGIRYQPWAAVTVEALESAVPWRTFRWYQGQRHYSGTYWSATTRSHVRYESRLELARLLFADFDPWVQCIAAQPFLLESVVEGKLRKHIPDFLLTAKKDLVVVDVKPRRRLSRPEVALTFAWTRQAVECRGWRYEVWSEPLRTELENVRFLAGYPPCLAVQSRPPSGDTRRSVGWCRAGGCRRAFCWACRGV
ncbi:TnsA-like heteromeric transposase endonuclease subunit [Streptomyces sp. NPDC050704]|uniref:TnsA-like heteromeric transposase endonuclease subunit n=1 Tax=Streptomyces sp. NPDC050704 TaxID=3157219 RepID=UPI00342C1B0F